jgi:hypothetical protein
MGEYVEELLSVAAEKEISASATKVMTLLRCITGD